MIDTDAMQNHIRDANPIPHVENLDTDELAHFVAAAQTRRATAMQAPTQPTPTTRQAQGRRSVWAFAAAFVVILVVVGAAALLLRNDDMQVTDEPVPTTSIEPTPSTTVAVPPTEPSLVESLVWSRVSYDEAVFGPQGEGGPYYGGSRDRRMAGVSAGGPGFVAVGRMGGAAAVWTSSDGLTWARIPHNEAAFGSVSVPHDEMGTRMLDVTGGGPGLVAVGSAFAAAQPPYPEVWVSSDGITWSRVPDRPVGDGPLWGVTAGGPGLVAVGGGQVWTSVDGLTWTSSPQRLNGDGEPNVIDGYAVDVVAGGPGLVAVGGSDWVAAVWTSTDGITWTRVPHDEAVFGKEWTGISSVSIGGPGLVAVGEWTSTDEEDPEAVRQQAAVWTSTDGMTWTRVPHDETVFGDSTMSSVAAAGNGLVAVGSRWLDAENCQYECQAAAVWTSTEGLMWRRVVHDEAVFEGHQMTSVTAGDRGVVAVGEGESNPAAWMAVPAD